MEQRAGSSGRAPGNGAAAVARGSGYMGRWCLLGGLVLVGMASSSCRQPAPPSSDEWAASEPVPGSSAPSKSATNPPPQPAPSTLSGSTSEPPGVVVQGATVVTEAPPSTDEAVIEVGGQRTRITRDTVQAIRTALLVQIEKSNFPHKRELIEQTRDTTISFGPELARFGLWILSAQGTRLQLIFRQPSAAPVVPYYQAEVSHRAGEWQVENLRLMSMRRAH